MYCYGREFNVASKRTWSRRQLRCESIPPIGNNVSLQLLTDLKKGEVLQYKKNSSQLTKQQRYSQIVKGSWVNRKTCWATQTEQYTNPNTSNLLRVNYTNKLVVNPSLNVIENATCSLENVSNEPYVVVKDGGTLLCNTIANPCTDEIYKTSVSNFCNSVSCSNVPYSNKKNTLCYNNGSVQKR